MLRDILGVQGQEGFRGLYILPSGYKTFLDDKDVRYTRGLTSRNPFADHRHVFKWGLCAHVPQAIWSFRRALRTAKSLKVYPITIVVTF